MKQLYVGVFVVSKTKYEGNQISNELRYGSVLIFADSEEEATGAVVIKAQKNFPSLEGWRHSPVLVSQARDEIILEAARNIEGRNNG